MKWKRAIKEYQYCPRCGLKCLVSNDVCPDCGLSFSRLKIATNKEAKNKILRHDRDFIIRTSTLPSDVSFIRLLLYALFLGVFGAHCFYVGRYLRGAITLGDFIAICLLTIFNADLMAINDGALVGVLSTICGLIMLFTWIWDVFMIIFKKFKVPVAIDLDIEQINSSASDKSENKVETISSTNSDIQTEYNKNNQVELEDSKTKDEIDVESIKLLIQEGKSLIEQEKEDKKDVIENIENKKIKVEDENKTKDNSGENK